MARLPECITVAEIIEALEGALALTACPDGNNCCGHPDTCALREVWQEAGDALQDYLRGISLATLLERQQHAMAEPNYMYWI